MPDDPALSRGNRRYRSPLRAERSRATRRRVVDAAMTHFLASGYAGTTVAAIAATAGVSVDTVFKAFGSKITVLKAVLDVAVGGDDEPVGVLDRTGPQALRLETDQRVQLRLLAMGVTEQLERLRPLDDILRSAAAVDAEAAALRDDIQVRQRRAAMHVIVGWVAARGPLREGLSVDDAAQVVWALTSPEVHLLMCGTGGWSSQAYREWLERTLADSILGT